MPRYSFMQRLHAWWEGYDLAAHRAVLPRTPGRPIVRAAGLTLPAKPSQPAGPQPGELNRHGKPLWTEARVSVAEMIWGMGYVTPGGDEHIPYLLKPLGLSPAMSVLDLSAGLGGTPRLMASKYGTWVSGMEYSPVLAAHGMARSITTGMNNRAPVEHYDAERFSSKRRFDCIFAKELFFSIRNKDGLLDGIQECLKSRGQFLFTDYVEEARTSTGGSLVGWAEREPMEPLPWSLEQWVQTLKKRRFDLRISENITLIHAQAIMGAMRGLVALLEERPLDATARVALFNEIELWGARLDAMKSGLQCYRFYVLKPF